MDGSGAERRLAEFHHRKLLVLAFLGSGCPLSGRSIDLLSRLQARFGPKGVQFVGICANLDETSSGVEEYAREYRSTFPMLRDPRQELADRLKARVTPEVFLLDGERAVRYRGWIESRGSAPTVLRTSTGEGLVEALIQVLAGRAVTTPVTRAGGCEIGRPAGAATSTRWTYHRDVAPILARHCQSCHRQGQSAPFALTTYAAAQMRAAQIKRVTRSREMPPWIAEPDNGLFDHVRRMPDAEVATLAAWAENGAPEGSSAEAPPARVWPSGWTLGEPDLVLKPAAAYSLAPQGDDEFRVFVLPTNLPEDRHVVAFDVRPGNPRVVHHVVGHFDTTGEGRRLDEADAALGYSSGPGGVLVPGASLQVVWTPGNSARRLPDGVARRLEKGSDLLVQVHYHKTGRPEKDQLSIGLYFAREPVVQEARSIVIGGWQLPIPAGEPDYRVRTAERTPIALRLMSVTPHMHLLGKSMRVRINFPDGSRKDLVWIRKWDYRWQETYRLKEPLRLPEGAELEIIARFDNSAANPRNPHRPPRKVEFGELTTNEMASVIVEAVRDK